MTKKELSNLSSFSMTTKTKVNLQMILKMKKLAQSMETCLTLTLKKPLMPISCSNARFLKMNHVLMTLNVDTTVSVHPESAKEMKMLFVLLEMIVRLVSNVSIIVTKKVHFTEEESVQTRLLLSHQKETMLRNDHYLL